VITAEGGPEAMSLLNQHPVSLLVTDLKMPKMDGFDLMGHVMEYFPDIPVIIITGYSTPEMKSMAKRGGAVSYMAKPFLIENIARKIMTTLRRESEGGTLHGVSSGIFLQLIEMEERTCTIRLSKKRNKKKGVLFFKDGELLDARYGNLQGVEAAYKIFSWDQVSIAIQNGCPRNEPKIDEDLQAVLLEAMRRKDETDEESDPGETEPPAGVNAAEPKTEAANPATQVRRRIEAELGGLAGLQDVYPDEKWDPAMARFDAIARALGGGRLKLALIDKGESSWQVLVTADPTVVAEVSPKCPREKLIQALDPLLDGPEFNR
jgi:CheY-like chemotaxis protein